MTPGRALYFQGQSQQLSNSSSGLSSLLTALAKIMAQTVVTRKSTIVALAHISLCKPEDQVIKQCYMACM